MPDGASLKALLRRSPLLSALNARVKCWQMKARVARIAARYEEWAGREAYRYDAAAAVEGFRQRLRRKRPVARPRQRGELRVFWIGASRSQDESGFLQALRRLANVTELVDVNGSYGQLFRGKDGQRFSDLFQIAALNDGAFREQVAQAHAEGGIDLVMGQMWATYLPKESLAWAGAQGIPVINVSMDDRLPEHWGTHAGVRSGAIGLADATDLVLTTAPETCAWYGLEGCPALYWPLASDPSVYSPPAGQVRAIDVLFIGNKYGVRASIVGEIERSGIPVECYGAGWPRGPVDARQMCALSQRAKIILGVGTVGHCPDVYTLKLRDFDAPMTGALYITHRNPDLCRLYEEGVEIECYSTPAEAARKIHHYLTHPDQLQRIAARGHALALRRDTWDSRLSSTFTELGLLEAESPAQISPD
jgi:hypothetical protein